MASVRPSVYERVGAGHDDESADTRNSTSEAASVGLPNRLMGTCT